MSNLLQFGGGAIKSIQRGVAMVIAGNTPGTITITAVDMSKSELRMTGQAASNVGDLLVIKLTSSTAITMYTHSGGPVTGNSRVAWELTEWH